jgi:hypothetical protein
MQVISFSSVATIWSIDPNGMYKNVKSIESLVDHGDSIFIEAAIYADQTQVVFSKNNLLIKGINGRPRLEGGATLSSKSNGKAIFVVSGSDCVVENIEFAKASVPDQNGAGIRQEGCGLMVRNCYFNGNENGILGGSKSPCKVTIEHCVFVGNGNPANPGFQHNVYVNHVDTLVFQFNLSADAIGQGHELKSRAQFNYIAYNYLSNRSSVDSRNIDLPNGGNALIVGNILDQGENSANNNLIGFGLEGLSNEGPHNLNLVNNTMVNWKSRGSFIQVKDGMDTLGIWNNILCGSKTNGLIIGNPVYLDSSNNHVNDDPEAPGFVSTIDYHLTALSEPCCLDKGKEVQFKIGRFSAEARWEYADTGNIVERREFSAIDIGAFEYHSGLFISNPNSELLCVYPNPMEGEILRIMERGVVPFQIYNAKGKYVYGGVFVDGAVLLPIPAGVFFIYVKSGVQVFVKP